LDIGESRDKTVLVVIQGSRERAHVRHRETHGKTDDELLAKLIGDAFSVYGCSRVAVDATGMGSFPAKAARRKWGPKLEPVTFTAKVKEDLATSLYQTLTDQTLWLPRDDNELRDDLCTIRRIVTTAGNVRFDAPRTAKGHADSAWALMLADHARGRVRKQGAYRELLGVERPRLASVL
jgi:phage FluMu gp28-like protein